MTRAAWLALLLPMALAGCGDDQPAQTRSFPPLHYEYLPKLQLDVGSIEVVDHSLPVGPQDVASSSPVVPAQALAQMARDRLFAAGTAGTASVVIDQASIVREPSGTLDGQLAVHLDLTGSGGTRTGFAEARVARQHVPGSDPEDGSANLYTLTRQMMDAMNVELEYQVRQSLRAAVVGNAVPTPVAAQPLASPGVVSGVPVAAPAPPPLPPAVPDAAPAQPLYQDPTQPPPAQMSPPPGVLQPPPGAVPLPPASGY